MIAAQVALNYGLFCRRIVFHDWTVQRAGPPTSQGHGREHGPGNLRQEIPGTQSVPGGKRPWDCLPSGFASIAGRGWNSPKRRRPIGWGPGIPIRNRHCVLSSGGKDSLLSFGLLERNGPWTCTPSFVNESGRHWFTALNAYRHFRDNRCQHGAGLGQCRPLFQLDAAADALYQVRFCQHCVPTNTPSVSVDRGCFSFRRAAADAQTGHRTVDHRRRVRHISTRPNKGN
jgi:hypothetical protein